MPATSITNIVPLLDESPCVFALEANKNSASLRYRVTLNQFDPAGHYIAATGTWGGTPTSVPQPGSLYNAYNSWLYVLDLSVARAKGADGKVSQIDYIVTAHCGIPTFGGKTYKPGDPPWKRPIQLGGDSSLERVPREMDFAGVPVLCSGDIPYQNPVLFDECRTHFTLRYNVDPTVAGFDLTAAILLTGSRNKDALSIPWSFLQANGYLTVAKPLALSKVHGRILSVRNQEDVWNAVKVTGGSPTDGQVYLKMTIDLEIIPDGFNPVPVLDGSAASEDIGFDQQVVNYNAASVVGASFQTTPDGSGKYLDKDGVILASQTDPTKRTYKRYQTGLNSSWKALFVGLDASVAPTGAGVS